MRRLTSIRESLHHLKLVEKYLEAMDVREARLEANKTEPSPLDPAPEEVIIGAQPATPANPDGTAPGIARKAAKYLDMTTPAFMAEFQKNPDALAADMRSLAGSALAQSGGTK